LGNIEHEESFSPVLKLISNNIHVNNLPHSLVLDVVRCSCIDNM